MGKSNGTYNSDKSALATFVLLGELILMNSLYVLFNKLVNDNHLEVTDRHMLVVLTLSYIFCFSHNGITLHRRNVDWGTIAARALRGTVFFAIVSGAALLIGGFSLPPAMQIVIFWCGFTLFVVLFRILVRKLIDTYRSRKGNVHHVIFMGSSDNLTALYDQMNKSPLADYDVEGYFDYAPKEGFIEGCKYLGKPGKVADYLKTHHEVNEVFCCLPSANKDDITPVVYQCLQLCVHFYSMPNISNYLHHKLFLNMFGSVPYFSLYREPLMQVSNRFVKRAFDIVFSLVVLCTIFPLIFIVVAIVTKLTMPGPIFFRQRRGGINGKEFYLYKFRSMKVNSYSDSLQATKGDPRVTKWGSMMRRLNIDEFPQFINVLLGQMSVVGPRPHMMKHNEDYSRLIDEYMVRHYVKPGITGWSQVTGYRGETPELTLMEGRVDHDIWYIEHWSLSLDCYIIYRTVRNMLRKDKLAY